MSNDTSETNTPKGKQTKFLLLLVSLLAFMVLEPFIFEYAKLNFLLAIFFSVILFASVNAASEQKRTPRIAILLALPKLGTTWALNFVDQPLLSLFDSIFGIIFIGYIIALILRHIFRQEDITRETIYGAIVAYILIGILWIFLYQFTEFIHPHSFSSSQALEANSKKIHYYFSFVTLSTLGYGDITPVSAPARSLAVLEAIVGQMYLAVLIARLVGMRISQDLMQK